MLTITATAQWSWRPDSATLVCGAMFGGKDYPMIVCDSSGGAIISWLDTRMSYSTFFGQRLSSGGFLQWQTDGVELSDTAIQQYFIINDGSNGLYLIWDDSQLSRSIEHTFNISTAPEQCFGE